MKTVKNRNERASHFILRQAVFAKMLERGTAAWADVPDVTAWLESLRANGCR